jgi:hypothetical protein
MIVATAERPLQLRDCTAPNRCTRCRRASQRASRRKARQTPLIEAFPATRLLQRRHSLRKIWEKVTLSNTFG